ncbi:MAG: tyrosine-type recombinase/integrase [Candidatus Electronema sp. V4]|uniref:tyrosine-type recombinase/integrase n=1 Tax=Candidatus Electronema sp. V4 TaxID=3454756 RepID=UPI0040556A63
MSQYQSTKFPGVRTREHATRKHGIKPDRYFLIRYQADGKRKEEGLGWASEGWTAEKAALKLAELKKAARTGSGEKRLSEQREKRKLEEEAAREKEEAERNKPTVADLWAAYQDSLERRKRKKVASTLSEEVRRWKNVIQPAIGHMKVEHVTPAILSDLLSAVAEKAPVSANRLHSLLNVMFKPALERGWITVHPLQWINKPAGGEEPRKRYLEDSEIQALWPCFDQLRPNPRDILKIILLTAQRPGEVMAMKWNDVDLAKSLWKMENTKNSSSHLVPLSQPVIEILKARKTQSNGEIWVFPSCYNKTKTGHAATQKEARKRLAELSGITGWTNHDLRRTARTIMSRLQIQQHIRERVLNHVQQGVAGVYDQYDYMQEKKDALDKLAQEIMQLVGKG